MDAAEDDPFLGPRMATDPSPFPAKDLRLVGKHVLLEGLTDEDVPQLWENLDNVVFSFLPILKHSDPEDLGKALQDVRDKGMVLYAVKTTGASNDLDSSKSYSEVVGMLAFLSIQPENRAIEIGAIAFGPKLRRTVAGTEALFLIIQYAFGEAEVPLSPPYRRVVWECNARNESSRRAAERLGFVYEGTFRKHMIYHGFSRDTAWLSMLDDEWESGVKDGFKKWLDASNFDAQGRQLMRMEDCRSSCKTTDAQPRINEVSRR